MLCTNFTTAAAATVTTECCLIYAPCIYVFCINNSQSELADAYGMMNQLARIMQQPNYSMLG